MQSSFRLLAAVVLILASNAAPAFSQILYGGLVGNVRDASEAAVAGASVTVTNSQTNQSRQTTTRYHHNATLPDHR